MFMGQVNNQFYRGYEGEKEIQIFTSKEKMVIWDGFFNDIMEQFKPAEEGWIGIAYYYHLYLGWCDGKVWKIPNIDEYLQQFRQLDITNCRFEESKKVLADICNMLCLAIQENENVWIAEG